MPEDDSDNNGFIIAVPFLASTIFAFRFNRDFVITLLNVKLTERSCIGAYIVYYIN